MKPDFGEPTAAFAAFTDLNDEKVKLVAYTIVSLRRGEERIMPGEFARNQMLVTERLTEEQLVAEIIGRYTASKDYVDIPKDVRDKERKYLRVYYVVSRRWDREPLRFEERQLDVLETIVNKI